MCIVGILVKIHPNFPFIVLNSREEYTNRPTIQPRKIGDLITPKDNKEGGTWTCFNIKRKEYTVLTNMESEQEMKNARSRGLLVESFSKGLESGVNDLKKFYENYNGFNIFHCDLTGIEKEEKEKFNFFTNRFPNLKEKRRNPIPGFSFKPPFQIVFASECSFLNNPLNERNSDFEKLISKYLKKEDFERGLEHLLKQCSTVLSQTFEDTEEDEYGFSKTRTQIVSILDKDGKLHYFHRDTDKLNKKEALEGKEWKCIES